MTTEPSKMQETPESVDESPFPHCPQCGAPLDYYHELIIENSLLYEASGFYDGCHEYEWFECPGCDYVE